MTVAVASGAGAWRATLAIGRILAALALALFGAVICAAVFPWLKPAARMRIVGRWSAGMLGALGIALRPTGTASAAPALLLANHVSWLDILALNAVQPVRFVSKSDVRRWPLIGFLVASGGTLFLERDRKRDALRVVHQIAAALRAGATIAVFPEGTTGDGRQLLPFHANLLQAAIAAGAPVQPVALRYDDRRGRFSPAVAWLGETTLLQSVWQVASADALQVHVARLPVLPGTGMNRRALAESSRERIRAALGERG